MHYRFAAVDLFSFRSVAGFVVAVCSVAADVAAGYLHLALVVAVHPGAAVAAAGFVVVAAAAVPGRLVVCHLVAVHLGVAVAVVGVAGCPGHRLVADGFVAAANVLCLYAFCCCAPACVS